MNDSAIFPVSPVELEQERIIASLKEETDHYRAQLCAIEKQFREVVLNRRIEIGRVVVQTELDAMGWNKLGHFQWKEMTKTK